MKKTRKRFLQIFVFVSVLSASWVALETYVGQSLHRLPLHLQSVITQNAGALAQSSKAGLLPSDYILVLGDSYAQGKGDWFDEIDKSSRPAFNSTHVLHEISGRDVISFGASGAGSLRGLVEVPLSRYEYIRSAGYELEKPESILVYFYEGNDLNDNRRAIEARYPVNSREAFLDNKTFDDFIEGVVIGENEVMRDARNGFANGFLILRHMRDEIRGVDEQKIVKWKNKANNIFSGFVGGGAAEAGFNEYRPKNDKVLVPGGKVPDETAPGEAVLSEKNFESNDVNVLLVGNRDVKINEALQSPALELNYQEIRDSVYVFERSLKKLIEYFPEANVTVLYIPSPLSSYKLSSKGVEGWDYEKRARFFPAERVYSHSDYICGRIAEVAGKLNTGFIDSRPFIREAAKDEMLHGPHDWLHFNEKGYTILANVANEYLNDKTIFGGCS